MNLEVLASRHVRMALALAVGAGFLPATTVAMAQHRTVPGHSDANLPWLPPRVAPRDPTPLALHADATLAYPSSSDPSAAGKGDPLALHAGPGRDAAAAARQRGSGLLAGCPVAAIASGGFHNLALRPDGVVIAWGMNAAGQLGDGASDDALEPRAVDGSTGLGRATAIAGGLFHSLAVDADGQGWGWGENGNGQLGDGTLTSSNRPRRTGPTPRLVAVAAGWYHSLALDESGQVWAWGHNGFGQLGDGSSTSTTQPVAVVDLPARVIAIAAGGFHSLALLEGGGVAAWGFNAFGALGTGDFRTSSRPVLALVANGRALAAGVFHSLAADGDGRAWAWGFNGNGQLGNGSFALSPLPVPVAGIHGIVGVAAREQHSLAWSDSGTAFAWGYNAFGQIGDGGKLPSPLPLAVPAAGTVTELQAGVAHSLARDAAGALRAWGFGRFGQMGDGAGVDRATPVEVATGAVPCANQPPEVVAGGPYAGGCADVTLDAAAASDAEAQELSWRWLSRDPDVTVSPDTGTLLPAAGLRPLPAAVATLSGSIAPCGKEAALVLEVTDSLGATASATTTVRFADETAPEVAPSTDVSWCLWPPNHRYVCFGRQDFAPRVTDSCSASVEWRFAGCASSQPDDDHGDGHTTSDCVVHDGGSGFCVRAERSGLELAGRRYTVTVIATDPCGNDSAPTAIGVVHVPHPDQPHGNCITR